jgi:heme exporter protein D
MQWGSVENFLEMGGYGFFVWSSYAMCVAVIVLDIVSARMRRKRALGEVAREAQLSQQRAQQAAAAGRTA